MLKRISVVKLIDVQVVTFSSVLEIGDAEEITPRHKALAVQREKELFYGREGNFNQYPLFSREIPKPQMDGSLIITRRNESHFINVNHIDITSISAGSIAQIGSNRLIDAEARVKHIRQLLGD
ncbi:spore germination protein GerPE [Halalkalibacter krulwichiae]|uniref:Putative spore germination protein GerPE n=1 Tax=Halalkalibacter krulwichiae TaxID=199441 RepID=A0A1X9MD60_9BACI|nr:spore germination protein GerPE [Halalkalibacter krulwichiae]ARK30063.1 putative spore germination protein GerPE [Halalkalibacter krulwichiae]